MSLQQRHRTPARVNPATSESVRLEPENLERRVLLSTVSIIAGGSEGGENMDLLIDGAVVDSWTVPAGGDAGQFSTFSWNTSQTIRADQVRVRFTNDAYDPANGIDSNLRVDAIEIDGQRFETEAPNVFSTGTWLPEDGVQPGFRESEYLNGNGYFQYATNDNQGSVVTIRASGSEGGEQFRLIIDGSTVQTFTVGTSEQTYSYTAAGSVDINDVRVEFFTDVWDPANGVDANLNVDFVGVDGTLYQTEAATTFSTGTWLPADGLQPGFRQSETLTNNGYFQFGSSTNAGSVVEIRALGSEGTEQMRLLINGTAAAQFGVSTTSQTYTYVAQGDIDAADVRIEFINDQWDPANGIDSNLTIDFISIDGVDFQTEDVTVFSTGTWLPTDGISPGFGRGETLNTNGYFQFGNPITNQPFDLNGQPVFQRDGHLYFLTSASSGWLAAQQEAASLGGNLVTVNDAAENNWLKQTFGTTTEYWIGFTDQATEGSYVWISGEPVTYTDWGTGEPNNSGNQDFGVMNFRGAWDDQGASASHFGIIEIGPEAAGDTTVDNPNGTGFVTETIAAGLVQPIAFDVAPDGRIFVTEKAGRVKVVQNGQVVSTFLDINEEVQSGHDRGLMGIALDPDFASNGHVFLNFSEEINPGNPDDASQGSDAAGRMIRISASATNPNVADLSSRVDVLTGHQMTHYTHTVGDVDFDNQGNLVFTWGDGGFDANLRLEAQDPNSKQGKLFRLNRFTFEGVPDNPYYDSANPNSTASKVWAVGVRNSWKLTVDRATGDVWMGEVTDAGPEEVNVMRADGSTILNYGWPYYEDDNRTRYGSVPANFSYERAFVALPHTNAGGGDSIVGGAVFRGDAYSEVYDGRYFFGNFNQGILYTADNQTGDYQQFGTAGQYAGTVDMQLGPDGHIWMMNLFSGRIERLVDTNTGSQNTDPIASGSATRTAGTGPLTVSFDAGASSDPDGDSLSYAWDFESDGIIDAGGQNASYVYSTVGRNTATLTTFDGQGGSDTRVFEIDVLSSDDANNVALGRPTTTSLIQQPYIGSRAVDGRVSGGDSFMRTLQQRTPLWEVDLGSVRSISDVELYVPSGSELSNFWILVSDTPFSSGNLDAARNDPGVTAIQVAGSIGSSEVIAVNATGRFLRIQRAGQNHVLSLAEVRVLG